jgi:DNA polymerase-1
MRKIVAPGDFEHVLENIPLDGPVAIDLETTGLRPHGGDRIFSIAMAWKGGTVYFDFGTPERPGTLDPDHFEELNKRTFSKPQTLWVAHNAKFDLGFLRSEGADLVGTVWCSQTLARVERNDHMSYSLDACLERIGLKKDDAVKAYMDKHKLFEWVEIEGKKQRKKNYHFDQVPLEIIAPYAMTDAEGALALFHQQEKTFQEIERSNTRKIFGVVGLEIATTKIVTKMERRGIAVDRGYCKKAADYERDRIAQAKADFAALAGSELTDSAKALGPVFRANGIDPGRTEKGNDSFTDDVLQRHASHPLVQALLAYRDANKRLGTYWSSFLYYSQWDGRIHCSLNTAGTATGRFSSSEPNLQNLTDDEKSGNPFPIREAFVPDPGCVLWSADYRQMEYRMMLDYAQEMGVIGDVLAGKDLHQACADMMGVDRSTAKTINFMLLYGGGTQKLADQLGVSYERAQELRNTYFQALPRVRDFVRDVIKTAEFRGYICNWKGRRYHFPDPSFAYKAPNYLIQGGGSDIVRVAMGDLDRMRALILQLQIHDELIGQIKMNDLHLLPQVKEAMIKAYPHRHLPMDVGLAISSKSLHHLEDFSA